MNAATVVAWVITRTLGVLIGPAAHQTELIGFGDVVSTVFEFLIVLGCVGLLLVGVNGRPQKAVGRAFADHLVNFAALAMAMVTILGMFSSVGGSPFVTHVG